MLSYPFIKTFQKSVTKETEYEINSVREGDMFELTASSEDATYRVWALDEETGLERLFEKCSANNCSVAL